MCVYLEAMGVFQKRSTMYGDLWREYGVEDNLSHMRSKVARADRVLRARGEGGEARISESDLVDSPLDLINYSVFFIRNVRGR